MKRLLLLALVLSCPFAASSARAEQKTEKIGVLLALTGDFAMFGEEARKGALVAADEIADEGEGKIELVFEDDRCLPKDAVTGFNKLKSIDGVRIVVGPGCTGGIVSIGPLAKSAKIPMLALFDTNDEVQRSGDHTFAIGFKSEDEGYLGAEEMRGRGYKKVGVLYETDAWATVVKDAFIRRFAERGGTIIADETQSPEDKDWRPNLTRMKGRGAEALYIVPAYNGGPVLKQIEQMKLALPVFGPDTFGIPEVIESAGAAAEGIVFTNVALDEGTPNAKRFLERYVAKFGVRPRTYFYAALGYDGVHLARRALRHPEGAVEGLKAARFPGSILGTEKFGENRMAEVSIGYWTVKDGKFARLPRS